MIVIQLFVSQMLGSETDADACLKSIVIKNALLDNTMMQIDHEYNRNNIL